MPMPMTDLIGMVAISDGFGVGRLASPRSSSTSRISGADGTSMGSASTTVCKMIVGHKKGLATLRCCLALRPRGGIGLAYHNSAS